VDGDGFPDILIGGLGLMGITGHAPYGYDTRAYLILASSLGLPGTMSLADADYVFQSDGPSAIMGSPVRGVGDVDGDGLDDIAVVQAHSEEAFWLAGQVFVYLGSDLGIERELYGSDSSFTFIGENMYDRCGISLDAADIDDDGRSDIFVGCDGLTGDYPSSGVVAVFMGGRLGVRRDKLMSWAHYLISGDSSNIHFGFSLSIIPSLDGDDLPDLAISAPSHEYGVGGWAPAGPQRGRTYVFTGDQFGEESALSADEARATIDGIDDDDRIGTCVANAGDFTDDGVDDLWIGSANATLEDVDPGQVYLMSGADLMAESAFDVSDAAHTFYGSDHAGRAGAVVAGVGDYNGDGRPDLFTVATGLGEAYLVFGR